MTDAKPTAIRQGRYRVDATIGRGGMATVYRARDLVLGRDVAIKLFLTPASEPEDLRTQEQEARLLASFSHHGLVQLFDVGIDRSDPAAPHTFLVMELVHGTDLRARLASGALPELHVAHLAFDVAEALGYVHEHGVVHRDIKPANVLLVDHASERRPRVKLTDFGVALLEGRPLRLREDDLTIGTAAYLSPEQVEGDEAGVASDVYALGLVLLESLTGQVAFPGAVTQSAFARLHRDPAVPDTLAPEWRDLLTAMTARAVRDRPTAADAALAFRQILVDELIAHGSTTGGTAAREVDRIAAASRYNVLGGGEDAAIDHIADLARDILHGTGAAVVFTDGDEVRIKSRSGFLPEPFPLEAALAAATAARIGDGGSVAAPVLTHDGQSIGALVVTGVPGPASRAADLVSLDDLASMVMHELEMRRAVRRIALARLSEP